MSKTIFHSKPIDKLNFLVTGGAGFVGSNLVEYLMENGAGMVRVLDNLLTGHRSNIEKYIGDPRFDFYEGDITDPAVCADACAGIHRVSHQAALGSVPRSIKDPARTNAINVGGTLNIFFAAKEAGVERVVYASSSSVYGDSLVLPKLEAEIGSQLSPYAVSKRTNELYANVFGEVYEMELIGLRYFNIFGPLQDPNGPYAAVIPLFIDRLMKGEQVQIDGDGEQTRDFTFVQNAVQANVRAMLTDNKQAFGEVFNIAVGSNFSVNQLHDGLCAALGIRRDAIHRESRAGDVRDSLADISKAKRLLAYDPQVSFEEGLQETVAYFKEKYSKEPI